MHRYRLFQLAGFFLSLIIGSQGSILAPVSNADPLSALSPAAVTSSEITGIQASIGWTIQTSRPEDWMRLQGEGVLNQVDQHFSAYLPAGSRTTWALTSEPIWVYRFPILTIRYRARGLQSDPDRPLLQLLPGSTGPVTPGAANIENPFARAGSMPISLPPDSLSDYREHEFSVAVRPTIRTEQIDQIILSLQSGDQPADFEILELSFLESGDQRTVFSARYLQNMPPNSIPAHFTPFSLPPGNAPLHQIIDGASSSLSSLIECAGVPFQIHDSRLILSTSLPFRGAISLNIHQSCSRLFLLMACDLAGTDSAFGFRPRTKITQPERLVVQLNYDDGTEDQAFPYNLNLSDYIVDASAVCCYAVPVDPRKKLETVRLRELMSYGRLLLLGATLQQGDAPADRLPRIRYPRTLASNPDSESDPALESAPARLRVEQDRYMTIETPCCRLQLDARSAKPITSLLHKTTGRNLLQRPNPLFSIQWGGLRVPPEQIQFQSYEADQESLELVYSIVQEESSRLNARVRIQPLNPTDCAFSLSLENAGAQNASVRLRFPCLSGIQISENIQDDFYLFPRNQAAWSNQPANLSGVHSGAFPLQFADLYSEADSCGLALHTRDAQLIPKKYLLEKRPTESRLGIDYGFEQPLDLPPGAVFETAPAVLQFHRGDWRAPFDAYKEWTQTWYSPNPLTRRVLRDVFVCRRDYPIGGTGYLFDPVSGHYTLERLIDESLQDLGGIDMIDISGWAYSEQYGRVGEYRRYELGGLQDFHRSIAQSQSRGVPVGLYFEGYLIDPRSTIGQSRGREWQIIQKDGSPKQWPGNQEIFICPLQPGWQDFMSQTLLDVASETGARAVYMDEYGFGGADKTCYAGGHAHAPGLHPTLAERQMLQTVRSQLDRSDRPIALYTEQTPNDVASQYVDAAFDYSWYGDRNYESPTKLTLFRFAFPTFKVIQLFHAGIDPRSASAEDVKLCFFHGEALWIKGRARSWFSRECRAVIRQAHKIFHDNLEAFTSPHVDPMIPTQIPGLYANRFNAGSYSIVTLYNQTPGTLRGSLIALKNADPAQAASLWEDAPLRFTSAGGELQIHGALHPHAVAAFRIENRAP
ncbi:MAG: hypothetical protein JXR73_20295 [Candidatus Omnitrophica bacterium]|nr:hypothetical protein [Candidatus Omnitrophota bacterium]